jgi:hypothetical protein
VKNPTPRRFFKKAPRLNPTLCKPIKIPTPAKVSHKGKVMHVTLSNGQSRLYAAGKWAQLQGAIKGGKRTYATQRGHIFNSETGRKAALKMWKRRKVMRWSQVRQGVPAKRRVTSPTPKPTVVAWKLIVRGGKKERKANG